MSSLDEEFHLIIQQLENTMADESSPAVTPAVGGAGALVVALAGIASQASSAHVQVVALIALAVVAVAALAAETVVRFARNQTQQVKLSAAQPIIMHPDDAS